MAKLKIHLLGKFMMISFKYFQRKQPGSNDRRLKTHLKPFKVQIILQVSKLWLYRISSKKCPGAFKIFHALGWALSRGGGAFSRGRRFLEGGAFSIHSATQLLEGGAFSIFFTQFTQLLCKHKFVETKLIPKA